MANDGDGLLDPDGLLVRIEVHAVGDDLVSVVVHGELDLSEAGELRAVLNDACVGPHRTVAVDLDDVRFMGSSALGVLVEVHQAMQVDGRRLVVRSPNDVIRQAFELTGLDYLLDTGP